MHVQVQAAVRLVSSDSSRDHCHMLPLLLLLLLQDFLRTGCDLEVSLKDLRLLLPTLSLDAAAIAGQAVALSQWHQVRNIMHAWIACVS
jgi:hypothetical protein